MRPAEIERLLPDIIQRTASPGTPLAALLEVMAGLHAPSEAVLANLDAFFDAYRAPEQFVPFLARWVDLEWLLVSETDGGLGTPTFAPGTGRLRELIVAAVHLSRWRGTASGLSQFLETATGMSGFRIDEQVTDEQGRPMPFHLRVVAPSEAEQYRVVIERIIAVQKPAYTTIELAFAPAHEARRRVRPRGGARGRASARIS